VEYHLKKAGFMFYLDKFNEEEKTNEIQNLTEENVQDSYSNLNNTSI